MEALHHPGLQTPLKWIGFPSSILGAMSGATIPALEDSLTPLKTGIKIESWVKQMDGYEPTGEDDEQMELSEIKLYEVLPKSS